MADSHFIANGLSQFPMPMGAAAMGDDGHSSHPSVPHLIVLVLTAIGEVVCVSLPGFVLAKMGLFGAPYQRWASDVNIWVFTPCLSTSSPPPSSCRVRPQSPSAAAHESIRLVGIRLVGIRLVSHECIGLEWPRGHPPRL